MDITFSDFHHQLPSILNAIATAHFVTIDLELSGIPGQQLNRLRGVGEGSSGKPSLQQRYEETKIAAERYQVLQLGITCVDEEKDQGVYVARPYNFFINPVADGRLDVERIFSFQSGAVEFLLSHGFCIQAPFIEGVSYFSREEESIARQIASARQNKTNVADIEIKSDDTEALEFVERVRSEIDAWKNCTTSKAAYVNIAPTGHSSPQFQARGLNNFQKRLVHQLVRAEYPGLVTISRPGFIQVAAFDKEREDNVQKSRIEAFEDRVKRQIGLRWVVEAMVSGDLSAIRSCNNEPGHPESEEPKEQYEGLFDRLQAKRTVLVGHNVFIDLIYFYACFFGPLPDKAEDFERRMHQLFPRIIDTKYLATHSSDNPAISKSSLEELDEQLATLTPAPTIETHLKHSKYDDSKPAHEAGFDSFLTAKVLIRLSAKLEAVGHYTDETCPESEHDGYETAPEDGGVPLFPKKLPLRSDIADKRVSPIPLNAESSDIAVDGVSLATESPATKPAATKTKSKSKKSKRKPTPGPPARNTAFSHATKFDLLGDMFSDEDHKPPITAADEKKSKPQRGGSMVSDRAESQKRFTMMPPFDSVFWNVYGNKLRVNGTLEGVCRVCHE